MIRRCLVVAALLAVVCAPARAQDVSNGLSVASNVDVTVQPLVQTTIALPDHSATSQIALTYAFVIQSPGPNSHASWTWDVSFDGGVTFPGVVLGAGGCDGGYIGVRGVPTLPLTPATCGDIGSISNDAAGKVVRLTVTSATGGLWTIVSATVSQK